MAEAPLDTSLDPSPSSEACLYLDASAHRALIFDMDGVITDTAALHARAWKQMFDEVLEGRVDNAGEAHGPFDIDHDYHTYVDGKPRLQGLRAFLDARRIDMPWGDPSDPVGTESVHGLGLLKNRILLELIEENGVEVFPGSVLLAGQARLAGLRSAVVTSSKNGPLIMERSGLLGLFDALINGNVAAELSLKGKPQPDIMIEAARRLEVDPQETVLFEDALAGVEAGRAAGMKLVVGVARSGNEEQLRKEGADVVVDDLSRVRLLASKPRSTADLSTANEALPIIEAMIPRVTQTFIFLDYDGTLTPIVARPELATLAPQARDTLSRLAARYTVAIISGRGLDDVRSLVGLDTVFYAGSHGFEIVGPEGMHSVVEQGADHVPVIAEVERVLRGQLDDLEGVLIERKRFSLAVHFRLASPESEPIVSEAVDRVVTQYSGLRRAEGKKVIEVTPDIDWDKGKAVGWLLEQLGADPGASLVIYMGDDITDEDAFRAMQGSGVGIVVADSTPRPTYADLACQSPEEVRVFLERLIQVGGRSPIGEEAP